MIILTAIVIIGFIVVCAKLERIYIEIVNIRNADELLDKAIYVEMGNGKRYKFIDREWVAVKPSR